MLTDCLFQNDAHKKDLEHVCYLIKLVGKNWLRYKTMLVLLFLPMQTFLEYTEFRCWRQHQSFEAWINGGFVRIKDLLIKGKFPAPDYFSSKIKGFNIFQYYQIKSRINKPTETADKILANKI